MSKDCQNNLKYGQRAPYMPNFDHKSGYTSPMGWDPIEKHQKHQKTIQKTRKITKQIVLPWTMAWGEMMDLSLIDACMAKEPLNKAYTAVSNLFNNPEWVVS